VTIGELSAKTLVEISEHLKNRIIDLEEFLLTVSPSDPQYLEKKFAVSGGVAEISLLNNILHKYVERAKTL
jgi:hypothetical protein